MFNRINDRFKKILSCNHEEGLAEAFRNGEEWAFSEIYAKFRKPIQRFVSQKVRDEEVASDLSQEIFLKVHRFRASYRAEYALSTWIWTIARNTVSDWFRRDRDSTSGTLATEGPMVEELASEAPNAEHLLEHESERARFARILGCLTEPQRNVLLLRLVHHLSYQEIASRLGISLSAVKCLVYRSKRALDELGCAPALA